MSPADAEVRCGAPGRSAATLKLRATEFAAAKAPLAERDAVMVQVPTSTSVTRPDAEPTVHTLVVEEVKVTGKPLVVDAFTVKGSAP